MQVKEIRGPFCSTPSQIVLTKPAVFGTIDGEICKRCLSGIRRHELNSLTFTEGVRVAQKKNAKTKINK